MVFSSSDHSTVQTPFISGGLRDAGQKKQGRQDLDSLKQVPIRLVGAGDLHPGAQTPRKPGDRQSHHAHCFWGERPYSMCGKPCISAQAIV